MSNFHWNSTGMNYGLKATNKLLIADPEMESRFIIQMVTLRLTSLTNSNPLVDISSTQFSDILLWFWKSFFLRSLWIFCLAPDWFCFRPGLILISGLDSIFELAKPHNLVSNTHKNWRLLKCKKSWKTHCEYQISGW